MEVVSIRQKEYELDANFTFVVAIKLVCVLDVDKSPPIKTIGVHVAPTMFMYAAIFLGF